MCVIFTKGRRQDIGSSGMNVLSTNLPINLPDQKIECDIVFLPSYDDKHLLVFSASFSKELVVAEIISHSVPFFGNG